MYELIPTAEFSRFTTGAVLVFKSRKLISWNLSIHIVIGINLGILDIMEFFSTIIIRYRSGKILIEVNYREKGQIAGHVNDNRHHQIFFSLIGNGEQEAANDLRNRNFL
jgi:hypothetical protein